MENTKKEARALPDAEMRVQSDSRVIEGYALLFNSDSQDLGGFIERIAPGALDGVLEKSDIFVPLNHQIERGLLARSDKGNGTLKLTIDQRGLKYEFEAPNSALGDEVLEGIKRRDIKGSSFVFQLEEDNWEKRSDGTYLRTITKFKRLFDVSPVYNPAYTDTSVAARSLESLQSAQPQDSSQGNYHVINNYKKHL